MNNTIEIIGAREHNLKNISINIPHNKFIVITGVSGSGKTSLAFNTIFAEGQRRYVESLSTYARQFLGRLDKPDVDSIKGIPPAIAIEQKTSSSNPRSTVGTSTEIYDYLRILFAKIGKIYSPISNQEVKIYTNNDVVNFVNNLEKGTKYYIIANLNIDKNVNERLKFLQDAGYSRIEYWNSGLIVETTIEEFLGNKVNFDKINLIVDRFIVSEEQDISRISGSVEQAFVEGDGSCFIKILSDDAKYFEFSNFLDLDGISFSVPTEQTFNFNSPLGACENCNGFGTILDIDENLIIPNPNLSIYDDAIACWKGEKGGFWKEALLQNAYKFKFPVHTPYSQLSIKEKQIIWKGNDYFEGIEQFFNYLESNKYKLQNRIMLFMYRGKKECSVCNGTRLKKESGYIKINGKTISDISQMQIKDAAIFFKNLEISEQDNKISKRILKEITTRLDYIEKVGLGYLTLNRNSNTLSGGESQRINIATSIGSPLVGSLYVLDEPSVGLHPRDTDNLIKTLYDLKNIGNTLLIVEHDEDIICSAEEIIDIGPYAGALGGELVFQGSLEELKKNKKSITAKYINKQEDVNILRKLRTSKESIKLIGASENNLKNVDITIPLNVLTCITGVSGSGKSSLIADVFYPAMKNKIEKTSIKEGRYADLKGDLDLIKKVEFVDQNPIGRSSRSNPATYTKVYDDIRDIFAEQVLAKKYNFKPSHFSFNVEGGRCESCKGEGIITIDMQFIADAHLICEECEGKRFKDDVLEVMYNGKSIFDVLNMTVEQAIDFFANIPKIISKLKILSDVGMGYIKLGQSSNSLSGGEAQRIKLASFLISKEKEHTLFIFDEPTVGLHFHDVKKLLNSINELIKEQHTVVIVEHNLDVVKCADWVIDLGKEGGNDGGNIVFEGKVKDFINCKDSYTAKYLKAQIQLSNATI